VSINFSYLVSKKSLKQPKAEDHWCEVVCRVLDMVWKIAERDGRRVPPHLVLVADNTPAQCHNQLAMRPLIYLTAKEYFTSITMFHLMVGHTHEATAQIHTLATASLSLLHPARMLTSCLV